jgi:hypothetical protein
MFEADTDRDAGERPGEPLDRHGFADDAGDYYRRLAAEIVGMMPTPRHEARRVLQVIHEILNIEVQPSATGELHGN